MQSREKRIETSLFRWHAMRSHLFAQVVRSTFFCVFVLIVCLVASCLPASAGEIVGRATVIDADTIEIHGHRIRLYGIDAPEGDQRCIMPDGSPWRCGQAGALKLADLLAESTVNCVELDTDRYRRVVAHCVVRGIDVNAWLVSEGWAMAYRKYSTAYVGAENSAHAAKRGIWFGSIQPPWEWRKEQRSE